MKKRLQELIARRAELIKQAGALLDTAEKENRELTEKEATEFDAAHAESKNLGGQIDREEKQIATEAALSHAPVKVGLQSDEDAEAKAKAEAEASKRGKDQPGYGVARMALALAANKGDGVRAAEWVEKHFGDEATARALVAGQGVQGGFLVQEAYSGDFIELLRNEAVIRSMGPVIVPMPQGNLTFSGLASGATASYTGEGENIASSGGAFRQVKLSAKKLTCLVPISNDLIRYATPGVEAIVRDDMLGAIAEREDNAFINGLGTEYSPKGLRYWAPTAQRIAANGTVNLANTTKDLGKLVLAVKQAKKRQLRRPGWLFPSAVEEYLLTVRDANGNFAFRAELLAGRLRGYPFAVTDQVSNGQGGGSDESEIFLADFADILVGIPTALVVDASAEAAYDVSGTLRSAYSRDETVIRIITADDLVPRHASSIAVLTAAKWTP